MKFLKSDKEIIPFPFPVYFWAVVFLALSGLADSIYIEINHYHNYTDMGYKSFCAISRAINCDTVSQSPYSIFLGVPISVWGIIGYAFFLLLMPFAWGRQADKKRMWVILFLVSLAFSLYSIILALISTYYIHSYCMMCIVSYAINLLLLFYTWLIRRRFKAEGIIDGVRRDICFLWQRKTRSIPVFSSILAAAVITGVFFPRYWNLYPPSLSAEISKGITEDGYPWIGAENPELVIEEFTDYQCFQCKKMHFFLRQLVEKYPEKIRLVHRHYPMDHEFNPIVKEPFHVGSGKLALLAIHAETKDRFWEMNDILFDIARGKGAVNIKELAEKVGLDYKKLSNSFYEAKIRHKLVVDIWEGMKLKITGTPAYVINDEVYLGQIPTDIIKNALD